MIYKEANTLVADNFTDGYFHLHDHVYTEGAFVPSRNGGTKEILNFKTELKKPLNRCVAGYNRNMNIFFLMAEAMWIFKGRRDLEFVEIFNNQMKEYSDGGKYFHAPYGWRLRKYGADPLAEIDTLTAYEDVVNGRDQLIESLELLHNNPSDRRVVVSLWNTYLDLGKNFKDHPCLSGDTRFTSPEGNKSIKEVYDLFNKGEINNFPIYCYDENKDEILLKNLDTIVYNGKKRTLKITLQNGTILKVTPDHLMYYRNPRKGTYKILPAEELNVGDYLLSDVFSYTPKGHLQHKKRLFENTNSKNRSIVHRQYYEFINNCELSSLIDIHHLNENKIDNRKSNLIQKDHGEHSSYHQSQKNNIHNETSIGRRLRRIKYRQSMRNNGMNIPAHEDDNKLELFEGIMKSFRLNKKRCNVDKKPNFAKIVSIEEFGEEDVYDFHVPDFHNALFESGVVIHNCNSMLMFKVRDGILHQTIQNRSNDLNWGLTVNVFQFSYLGEIMSEVLGVRYGTQVHNSQSLHLYLQLTPLATELQARFVKADYDMFKKQLIRDVDFYDKFRHLDIDLNFKEAGQSIKQKMYWVDFYLHSIIVKLLNRNKGIYPHLSEEESFLSELKDFCYNFWVTYQLLMVYVDYKKHKSHEAAISALINLNTECGLAAYDIFFLSVNFFMRRILDKDKTQYENVLKNLVEYIPSYRNYPVGKL